MQRFILLLALFLLGPLSNETQAQVENILLDYDFDGWLPEELVISYEGNPNYDSTLYKWRSALNIPPGTPCPGDNNFLLGGNNDDPSTGLTGYQTCIDFPATTTLGFDSLHLSFGLLVRKHSDVLFSCELSADSGVSWFAVYQEDLSTSGSSICVFDDVLIDITDYATEDLMIRLRHEGWKLSAVDNFLLVGYSDSNTSIGCTQPLACNYDELATTDDGSCLFVGYPCDDGDESTVFDVIQDNCLCEGVSISGCTYESACNYNPEATEDDESCLFIGDPCDDGNPDTENDMYQMDCSCLGEESNNVLDNNPLGISIFPNPTHEELNIDLGELAGKMVRIVIYDTLGKTIHTSSASNMTTVNLTGTPSGTYTVELTAGEQIHRSQVVVKRP